MQKIFLLALGQELQFLQKLQVFFFLGVRLVDIARVKRRVKILGNTLTVRALP